MVSSQEKMVEAVSEIFAKIHVSVVECSKKMMIEMKRPNYVTPTNYLELVTGYKKYIFTPKFVVLSFHVNRQFFG